MRLWRLPHALDLTYLPLLQELCLLSMLMFHRRLRLRVGILLSEVGVIALLHLRQGIALLLLPRLHG